MVTAKRIQGFETKIEAGEHLLTADVLSEQGGTHRGPSPHELLESALAACTTITVQMYASRKGWELESADTQVKILSESREGSVISREITLRGNLTEEQKRRLLEIAERCPIHKLLSGKIEIQTKSLS